MTSQKILNEFKQTSTSTHDLGDKFERLMCWAKDVAKIAESLTSRIKALLESSESEAKQAFDEFITGLHQNINPNVT
ncbi:MAG: hypothetical protein ACKPA7_04445, partial [Sphaerospermopsis kisseleviana]